MSRGIFKSLKGSEGKVTVPHLGALVGTFTSWTLTRRGDDGPESERYNLHGIFSFVNKALFEDDEYVKSVEVRLSKTLSVRLRSDEGTKTSLNGRALVMEGVQLWPEEH